MSRPAYKPHEQDISLAAKAAGATRFNAFLFNGRGARYRREAETFAGAVDAAIELEHDYAGSRRALIYAIVGTYTVPIDENVARLAGFDEEDVLRFFDRG